jgi:hypothetical protein
MAIPFDYGTLKSMCRAAFAVFVSEKVEKDQWQQPLASYQKSRFF